MLHEQAIELITDRLHDIGMELRKTVKSRLDAQDEEASTAFEARRHVVGQKVTILLKHEKELNEKALDLARSLRELEDAQEREKNGNL